MDGHPNARHFASDLAAGAGVGGAVGWALASVFHMPLWAAACLAGVAFIRVFCSLRRLHGGTRFALAPFQPAAFAFDTDLLELDAVAASIAAEPPLEPRAEAMPTVKQLQDSIRQRLNVEQGEAVDAADELRSALRDLRRSIG